MSINDSTSTISSKTLLPSKLLFIAILTMNILSGTEVDLILPSFPELQQYFNISLSTVQLTLSCNFMAFCVGCVFAGALGDLYTPRRVIILGLILFTISSFICTNSESFSYLLIGRILQGLSMSPISVLSLVVAADHYPIARQQAIMGILNGCTNFAMAVAPVIGSFMTLYFGWRSNFSLLGLFGIGCLLASYYLLPVTSINTDTKLSFSGYITLLKSTKLLLFVFTIATVCIPFWIFISIAPILYMNDLQVELKHFGFYQGAMCASYAFINIVSPGLLTRYGNLRCFICGMTACLIGLLLIIIATVTNCRNPLFITTAMVIFNVGTVFPINILYPQALNVYADAKGKTSAIILIIKWLLVSGSLYFASTNYDHSFRSVGIVCTAFIIIFLVNMRILIKQGHLQINQYDT